MRASESAGFILLFEFRPPAASLHLCGAYALPLWELCLGVMPLGCPSKFTNYLHCLPECLLWARFISSFFDDLSTCEASARFARVALRIRARSDAEIL
jgi:hypothetical protein